MKDMLEEAREGKYAIGAFDVSNYEMVRAVVDIAEELKSPVILMGLRVDMEDEGMNYIVSMAKTAAKASSVPICLHLDHAREINFIKRAIDNGFTSVMVDGSKLSFDENVNISKKTCNMAHRHNITVEAELGHVTDAIVGDGRKVKKTENAEDYLTKPEEAQEFIDATGVDALAVAIGTAHGVYKAEPKLDINRLRQLNAISSVPLVMHGGSGVSDKEIKKSIEAGMCKINIYSELLNAFFSELKDELNNLDNMSTWPSVVYKKPIQAMKEVVRDKMKLFNSVGKA